MVTWDLSELTEPDASAGGCCLLLADLNSERQVEHFVIIFWDCL